jgi:hypothetical protein
MNKFGGFGRSIQINTNDITSEQRKTRYLNILENQKTINSNIKNTNDIISEQRKTNYVLIEFEEKFDNLISVLENEKQKEKQKWINNKCAIYIISGIISIISGVSSSLIVIYINYT